MGIVSILANLVAVSSTCKEYKKKNVCCRRCNRFGYIEQKDGRLKNCRDYRSKYGEMTQAERYADPYGTLEARIRKHYGTLEARIRKHRVHTILGITIVILLSAAIIAGSIWYVQYS